MHVSPLACKLNPYCFLRARASQSLSSESVLLLLVELWLLLPSLSESLWSGSLSWSWSQSSWAFGLRIEYVLRFLAAAASRDLALADRRASRVPYGRTGVSNPFWAAKRLVFLVLAQTLPKASKGLGMGLGWLAGWLAYWCR